MDKSDECRRYKWSSLATNLLVSIWCHDLMQNQLKISSRNQAIWEGIARYMSRKGFPVTGLQCRTRIKNMLCSYHEAVRKNDPSGIEPYYDIFKKVLSNKISKKKDTKVAKSRQVRQSEESEENEMSLDHTSFEVDQSITQNATDSEYQMEFLDVSNKISEPSSVLHSSEIVRELEKVILKATEAQTKAITDAIKMQSEMIEKLLVAERERLETVMASERESRKQLETRLDRLLSKFEAIDVPQVSCVGTEIEESQQ